MQDLFGDLASEVISIVVISISKYSDRIDSSNYKVP